MTSGFAWANSRMLGWPSAVGLVAISLVFALAMRAYGAMMPSSDLVQAFHDRIAEIHFSATLLQVVLAFLLFAAALNIESDTLRERAVPILVLSVLGTAASAVVTGLTFAVVAQALGQPIPLAWSLVFGAVISPTDPIAVSALLKSADVGRSVRTELEGESLLNDGVSIVLLATFVSLATGQGELSAFSIAADLAREAGGGLLLGLATGYVALCAMRSIDDFTVEALITLALVAGTYALALRLGVSGPLAVVAAGLLVGERGARYAMSEHTQSYVSALWTLVDEVLNSVLFMLIGLEVLVLSTHWAALKLALTAPFVALVGRIVAVGTPLLALHWTGQLSVRNAPVLVWAGVRGGISVALALSLPESAVKTTL
ncbi:MAG: sodium:proton antiporter, partial [Proteobacteria bacterium]|nr:sodium:proton antiporter [Pseudomonadota bacterium]